MIKHTSIPDVLSYRKSQTPAKNAFVLLDNGETIGEELSYQDLYHQSEQIAQAIHQKLGQQYQDPVLMLYPPGLDFIKAFLACQISRTIAVPVFPPRSTRHLDRLVNVVLDSGATTILTISEEAGKIQEWIDQFGASFIKVIATDTLEAVENRSELENPKSEDVAFIQYTSGSTGIPKGVTITNENLMANELLIGKMSELDASDVLLNWLPFYHDMGLIGNILFNIYNGSTCFLMTPFDFIKKPARWLKAISQFDVTVSGGPNFAYDLCTEKIEAADLEGVDLSKWKMAFNGAEPVRPETLEDFGEKFARWGFNSDAFFPCYGLAEATLFVCGGGRKSYKVVDTQVWEANSGDLGFESGSIKRIVSAGKIWWEDIDIKIVHPESGAVCEVGTIGEIWISGKSVTRGYWRSEEDIRKELDGRKYLPTGDLGSIYQDELYITGRLKEMIIIHGQNYYPYDIEKIAGKAHPAIHNNGVAAFAIEVDKEEKLVLLAELKREYLQDPDGKGIFAALQKEISNFLNIRIHDIVLLKPFEIERTSSGKIMRIKCRKKYLKGAYAEHFSLLGNSLPKVNETDLVPEQEGSITKFLQRNIEELTGSKIDNFSRDTPVIDFGLDSIHLLTLSNILFKKYGKEIDVTTIFEGATVAMLEQKLLEDDHQSDELPDTAVSREALSANQKSLWYIENINTGIENNIGLLLEVKGAFDLEQWTKALLQLHHRHEALRTTYHDQQGHLVANVAKKVDHLPVVTLVEKDLEKARLRMKDSFNEAFDLTQLPLTRLIAIEVTPDHHLLAIVGHHLNADGWSFMLLFKELYTLLQGGTLDEEALPYAAFVAAEKETLQSSAFQEAIAYYKSLFDIDFQTARFLQVGAEKTLPEDPKHLSFSLDKTLLTKAAASLEASPFLVLLGIYHLLLSIYNHNEEVITASPVTRRDQSKWAQTVGYFSNLQYLKSTIRYDQSFRQLVHQLKAQFMETHVWQRLPYSRVVENIFDSQHVEKRALLNQFLFTYQSLSAFDPYKYLFEEKGLPCGEMNFKNLEIPQQTNVFDLSLEVFDTGKELFGFLKYKNPGARLLFEDLLANFNYLLSLLGQESDLPLRSLSLIEPSQTEALRSKSEVLQRPVSKVFGSIVEGFEYQVEKTPDAPALFFEGEITTYRELNEMANQLAHYFLDQYTLQKEDFIGLQLRPGKWLVAGIWAILKCGAAYVPIDPDYPEDRKIYMAEDAGLKLILEKSELLKFSKIQNDYSKENLTIKPQANQLAYLLYTSGTTGKPKGVMIEHHSVLDYTQTVMDYFAINARDKIIQQSSISFDTMVEELFPCLLTGAQAILLRHGGKDVDAIIDAIENQGATILSTTPLVVDALNKNLPKPHQLRVLISGGDVLEARQLTRLIDMGVEIYNTYGPTEATVCATYAPIRHLEATRSIGRPITNKSVYILSDNGQLAPTMVEGEICIGGAGLARAYWKRPELTAEKFVAHPFVEGAKIYRTGDAGRWLPDGEIEFLGRLDDQVKIRGHRIELAEVENTLNEHPALTAALVVATPQKDKSKILVAYYLKKEAISSGDLRQFLQEKLPAYMVPAYFVSIDEIPLSPSGKIDRKALVLPEELAAYGQQDYEAPANEIEEKLVDIWSEVLQIPREKIGTQNDFFELGGESLLLMKVKNAIEINFGVTMEIATLLKAFNIKAIATYLDSVQWFMQVDARESNPENEIIEI